ncbi:MAG: hypothetical protein JWN62_1871 [Acidimicrobiales bacterium]|nr:hypothetical protein [Acidimicrobiales bacterium]
MTTVEMSPIEVQARRGAELLRSPKTANWAFVAALVASIGVYYLVGRHQDFTRDDWASLISRQNARRAAGLNDFLNRPQDGHWLAVPEVVYWATRSLFGLGSYWPFLIPALAAHVATVLLIRVLCLRHGVSAWTTTLVCTMLLVFGAGWQNLVFAIQISFNFTLLAFLAQLVLVDHDGPVDRRDYLAAFLVLFGVMSSGFGPIFMVGIFVVLALRQRWKALLVALVPQVLLYGWWYLSWVLEAKGGVPTGNRSLLPIFLTRGVSATFDGLTALPGLGGIAIVGTLVISLSRRFGWRTQSLLIALVVTVCVMYSLVGFERLGLGIQFATESRYVYVAGMVIAPAFALAVDQLGRISREVRWGGLAVLCLAIGSNLSQLVDGANRWAAGTAAERHTLELIAGSGLVGQADPRRTIFTDSPDVTPAALPDLVARGALTPITPVTPADKQIVSNALGIPVP